MSWMDSWSRPGKSQPIPPPLYLTPGGSRKPTNPTQPVKYCSDRCRAHKPGPQDRQIETTLAALLNGADPATLSPHAPAPDQPAAAPPRRKKGDPRLTVSCLAVETLLFGARVPDPAKRFGRRKNRAARALGDAGAEWRSVDMVERPGRAPEDAGADSAGESSAGDTDGGGGGGVRLAGAGRARPPQAEDEVNFSVGGERGWAEKIAETDEMRARRLEGARKAEEREMVKRAARRLCAFGVVVEGWEGEDGEEEVEGEGSKGRGKGKGRGRKGVGDRVEQSEGMDGKKEEQRRRRKCEAVVNGQAVEASFAKGEWGIRWRE